ncbi:MAG: hypothetical protein OXF27_01175 [Acidobacteria bacterium]|nr:hypothetical protein [Acidobacteriota bacterium]
MFRKARILAMFDDLDTMPLMIPLKMLMVGIAWQLGLAVVVMAVMLAAAYRWLHVRTMPVTWGWMPLYAAAIVAGSELLHVWSTVFDASVPIHIEVLLPAFVLGCMARPPAVAPDADAASVEHAIHDVLDQPGERRAAMFVSAAFMVLVALSMPSIFEGPDAQQPAPAAAELRAAAPGSSVDDPTLHGGESDALYTTTVTASQPSIGWGAIVWHVLVLTFLSNFGKAFPAFCYRRKAHWRHRLAIAMWPRGEVGAGVLVLSLSYGIGGPIVTVAMLSLALNLALTGVYILVVRRLIDGVPETPAALRRGGEASGWPHSLTTGVANSASATATPGGGRGQREQGRRILAS